MAKIVIPGDGKQPSIVRNFDEYQMIDLTGRVISKRRATGTWVLTRDGSVRQLSCYLQSVGGLDTQVFKPMFFTLLGAWIFQICQMIQ